MDNRTFNERAGIIIISVCIVALLGAFAFSCFLVSKKSVNDVSIEIRMPVDSTGVLTEKSILVGEDLKAELTRHEQLIEDRYKHVLEQKETLNDIMSIGSAFLAVILALFGFFGYKSMSSIEEKVEKKVKNEVDDFLREEATDQLNLMKTQISTELETKLTDSFEKKSSDRYSTMTKRMEAMVNGKVTERTQMVGDLNDKVTGFISDLSTLDQKVVLIEDKLNSLESLLKKPNTSRRTISGGGE